MVITRRRWVRLIEGSPISRIFSSSYPLSESEAPGSPDHPSRILTPTKGYAACLCRGTFGRNKLHTELCKRDCSEHISDNASEMRASPPLCKDLPYFHIESSKETVILLLWAHQQRMICTSIFLLWKNRVVDSIIFHNVDRSLTFNVFKFKKINIK